MLRPAPKIFKDDCRICWQWTGRRIVDFVRGLSPYPAAWMALSRTRGDAEEHTSAKVFEVRFEPEDNVGETGRIICDGRESIAVTCADGVVHILSMQMAGKRRMSNHDLLLGLKDLDSYHCE